MTESSKNVLNMFRELQAEVERDKAELARTLHDQLGSLLLAASMDASQVETRLGSSADDASQKMQRLKHTLAKAVDLTRRITEELHPSLLDSFGLVAAMRWHLQQSCLRTKIRCIQEFPEDEPSLDPAISIAVFRVVQELFDLALLHPPVGVLHFLVRIDNRCLIVQAEDDGERKAEHQRQFEFRLLASIRHRVRALGGAVTLRGASSRGTRITATIPLHA
jgi:signal transduction histidine kinase